MKTTKIVRAAICLTMMAVLSACTAVGDIKIEKQTKSSVAKHIAEGKTTKAQIISELGKAGRVSFTIYGDEVWIYKVRRVVPDFTNFIPFVRLFFNRGTSETTKEIVVVFNQAGVVSEYTMDETKNRVEYRSPKDELTAIIIE